MRFRAILMAFVLALAYPMFAFADMTSTNYIIRWDTVSTGGGDTGVSASYQLRDTVGGTGPGAGTSTSYQTNAGYRGGVNDRLVTFAMAAEDRSTQVAASGLSGTTVSVASTAGFSAGDFIAVVQDLGASQVAAVGKITSVGVGTLTVDTLTDSGSAPTVDGTNDYVYKLSGSTIAYGTLSTSVVATGIVMFDTMADVDNGYTIQALSDGLLRTGSSNIPNVSDGTVTAGSAENGARSSDTSIASSTFDTQDTPITTSYQTVVDKTTNAFEDRSFLTLKTAISPATAGGSYAQTLTFIMSGNY